MRTSALGTADQHWPGKSRGGFPRERGAGVGALWAAAFVWLSGQRHDGIDPGDFARRPGGVLEAELFPGRCGAGGDGEHQTGNVEVATVIIVLSRDVRTAELASAGSYRTLKR